MYISFTGTDTCAFDWASKYMRLLLRPFTSRVSGKVLVHIGEGIFFYVKEFVVHISPSSFHVFKKMHPEQSVLVLKYLSTLPDCL